MRWESNDGYNEYFVAESAALDDDELLRELRNMIEAVYLAHPSDVTFTVNVLSHEVNAPEPDHASHLLRVGLMHTWTNRGWSDQEVESHMIDLINCSLMKTCRHAHVKGAWGK